VTLSSVALLQAMFLGYVLGCGESAGESSRKDGISSEEHAVLAGSFVSGDTGTLAGLLDPDLVVQPPLPDTALRGPFAKSYLLELAANTSVIDSRFHPEVVVPEGTFAFEQGIWELRTGSRRLLSRYALRWRNTAGGWRVVLWRWGPFQ